MADKSSIDISEEIEGKLVRFKTMKYWQSLPDVVSAVGYELTPEEKRVISEWANANAKMAENARLFALQKEVVKEGVPYATYPGSNGCATCCNYAGCALPAAEVAR